MGHIGEHVTLDDPAYIHESAWLYGKVYVGPGASIWPNVVTRAETFEIRIGARTNIQDFVMIHVGIASPTVIGEDCSITHHATLHGCDIGDRCLIGINATIMDGAKIGENSIVAGHTIITENKVFPPIRSSQECQGRWWQRETAVKPMSLTLSFIAHVRHSTARASIDFLMKRWHSFRAWQNLRTDLQKPPQVSKIRGTVASALNRVQCARQGACRSI